MIQYAALTALKFICYKQSHNEQRKTSRAHNRRGYRHRPQRRGRAGKNGYDVVVNYSRSEEAAKITAGSEAAGARAMLQRADVSDDAAVRAMLAATEKEFGRLDVLINNAGTTAMWSRRISKR